MTVPNTSASPPPDTSNFLTNLYANAQTGWLTLFAKHPNGNQTTEWAPATQPAEIAAKAALLGEWNVWFGCATRNKRLEGQKRGGKDDCAHLYALWVDIDVEGPGHNTDRLPTEEQAWRLIDDFPLAPTVIVNSGHGLQPWWALEEPHDITDSDLLARWGATWARRAREAGFHLDNVFDAPRIMRLPGTINTKPGCPSVLVTIEHDDWRMRYGVDDIDPYLDAAPEPPVNHRGVPYIGPGRPGDAYNARHTTTEQLHMLGFIPGRVERDGTQHWKWPAAAGDQSATTYPDGHATIWSETAAQQLGVRAHYGYDAFGLYTQIKHRGNHAAAAADLADNGYGTPPVNLNDLVAKTATPVDADETETETAPLLLFHDWTPAELLDADTTFNWLIEGMYAMPTYGMTAGESKTAKTTVGAITEMSLAAGIPVFGHFEVPKPRAVIIYVGEGGRIPHTRLLARVAQALGIDWRDLPIYPRYEIANITSPRFQATLERDLEKYEPGLVVVDPYYAFHGAKADAKNLHEEAEVLNLLSSRCTEANAVLDITNHFNRGDGKGLRRITMAGGAEWVDTWRLLEHREPPDIDHGQFKLRLEIGSRQWGGTTWDLNISLGVFQPKLGLYDGSIAWELTRPGKQSNDPRVDRVIDAVTENPFTYTKEELAKRIGGRATEARQLVDFLERAHRITPKLVKRPDSAGRNRDHWCYGITDRPEADALSHPDAQGAH